MQFTKDQLKAINTFKEFLINDHKYMIIQGGSGVVKVLLLNQ